MKFELTQETLRSTFVKEVEARSKTKLSACYQCGKCSAGCPISFRMDYLPNQIIRLVQLGMREEVLSSKTMWLCASCQTCTTRCPQEVDIAEIMDVLRRISYDEYITKPRKWFRELINFVKTLLSGEMPKLKERNVLLFNEIFLQNIRSYGKLFEMGLIANFNLNSGLLFKNISKGLTMFLKGKIALFPSKPETIGEVKEIFTRAEETRKT